MNLINSLYDYSAALVQNIVVRTIKQGPVPKHVAIILDGNRRFARKMGYKTVTEGHRIGANKISEIWDVCLDIGVSELSVYSFSTENFNRSREEVKGLMKIFTLKVQEWCDDKDNFHNKGIGFEVVGDYTMAPTSYLQHLFAKLMWSTRANKKLRVNFAFAYMGREEITKGLNSVMDGLEQNEIRLDDVNEKLVKNTFTLGSSESNPVDLLIRTGGDQRLSDFMMWQSSHAYLDFMENITWPEFNYWHLARSIFRYQMQIMCNGFQLPFLKKEEDFKESLKATKRKTLFLANKVNDEWKNIMARA